MKKFIYLFVFCSFFSLCVQAHALLITPTSPTPYTTGADYSGNQTSTDVITTEINALNLGVFELYKQNADDAFDTGLLKDSYSTVFNSDKSGATITYVGGNYIGEPQYLLVKDGNHTPYWYLFDISGLWDGQEIIELQGFWPGGGSISHVAIYGTSTPAVPEPGTMVLLGAGMLGLAIFGKRRMNRG